MTRRPAWIAVIAFAAACQNSSAQRPQAVQTVTQTVTATPSAATPRAPRPAVLPALVGMALPDAIAALTRAHLAVGRVGYRHSPAPHGQVLTVHPSTGTRLTAGRKVTLTVSTGTVWVPYVVAESRELATAELQQAGFGVRSVPAADYHPGSRGLVADQVPGGDSYAPNGSTVTIYVEEPPKN